MGTREAWLSEALGNQVETLAEVSRNDGRLDAEPRWAETATHRPKPRGDEPKESGGGGSGLEIGPL